jgi:hypothetical protein
VREDGVEEGLKHPCIAGHVGKSVSLGVRSLKGMMSVDG